MFLVTKGTNKDLFQRHTAKLNRKELIYLLKNDKGKEYQKCKMFYFIRLFST